jgi:endo-1,3-1,4-beta-glycanase ExoK
VLIPLLLLAAAATPGHGAGAAAPAPVEITRFAPEHRTLEPGGVAVSELVVRNAGAAAREVWIGYSLQDSTGRWYDVPARPVTVPPRSESAPQRMEWAVPADPGTSPGSYRVVMAVWTAAPGSGGAERLASADQSDAFRVRAADLPSYPGSPDWQAGSHALGRGRLRPALAVAEGAGFRLRLPAGRCDGAEIRSTERVYHGEYSARIRTPEAPGSLSAFFLYEDVRGGNDEIDIEIYNDGSRRAHLTVWIAGKSVHETIVALPFDPAAEYHDYTIRWHRDELAILADGALLGRWTSRLPNRPMRVMANAWWPTWLRCEPVPTDRDLLVESLRVLPLEAPV